MVCKWVRLWVFERLYTAFSFALGLIDCFEALYGVQGLCSIRKRKARRVSLRFYVYGCALPIMSLFPIMMEYFAQLI